MLGWSMTHQRRRCGRLAGLPLVVRWAGRRNLFVGCVVLACTALFGLATLPEATWALLLLAALTGLLWGPVNPILNLAMQVLSPENMRGRVIGVVTSAAFAAGPIGLVVAGPLVDAFGVEPTSIGVAAVVLATSLVSFVLPLRGFDDLVEPAGAESHLGSVPRADVPPVGGGVPGDSDLDDDRRLSP